MIENAFTGNVFMWFTCKETSFVTIIVIQIYYCYFDLNLKSNISNSKHILVVTMKRSFTKVDGRPTVTPQHVSQQREIQVELQKDKENNCDVDSCGIHPPSKVATPKIIRQPYTPTPQVTASTSSAAASSAPAAVAPSSSSTNVPSQPQPNTNQTKQAEVSCQQNQIFLQHDDGHVVPVILPSGLDSIGRRTLIICSKFWRFWRCIY